jgi:hypothetical protein
VRRCDAAPLCRPRRTRPRPGRAETQRNRGCSRERRTAVASISVRREPHGPRRGHVTTEAGETAAVRAVRATPSRGGSTRRAAQRRPQRATDTRSEPPQQPYPRGYADDARSASEALRSILFPRARRTGAHSGLQALSITRPSRSATSCAATIASASDWKFCSTPSAYSTFHTPSFSLTLIGGVDATPGTLSGTRAPAAHGLGCRSRRTSPASTRRAAPAGEGRRAACSNPRRRPAPARGAASHRPGRNLNLTLAVHGVPSL